MFNIAEPYSGHFFKAEYFEYDTQTKSYKPSVEISLKGHQSIGVATGVKEVIPVQDMNGKVTQKETYRVHVVNLLPFKYRDKIKDLSENKTYFIYKVSDDITHPNSSINLMFPNSSRRPKILNLGE